MIGNWSNGMRALLLTVFALMAGAGALHAAGVPSDWTFTLPAGDAVSGEKTFENMKCYTCHNVSGREYDRTGDNPGNIGPNLTAEQAGLPREYLAESIINFDRWKAHGRYTVPFRLQDGTSRMGNYREAMTLKEMVDVVEFLRSIK